MTTAPLPLPYATRPLLRPEDFAAGGWDPLVRWLWSSRTAPLEQPGVVRVAPDALAWSRLLGGEVPRGPGAWIAEADASDLGRGGRVYLDARGRVYQVGPGHERRVGLLPGSASDAYPRLVISGGQTGADRGALDAATLLGLPVGGWAPRGYRSEEKSGIPLAYRAYLREARGWRYEERTTLNILDGDGTLVVSLGERLTTGSARTYEEAGARGRPRLHQVVPGVVRVTPEWDAAVARVQAWLLEHRVGVLNVAGPRQSKEPGVGEATWRLLTRVLSWEAS